MFFLKRFMRDRRAATAVEYGLTIGLIAVVILAATHATGRATACLIQFAADTLSVAADTVPSSTDCYGTDLTASPGAGIALNVSGPADVASVTFTIANSGGSEQSIGIPTVTGGDFAVNSTTCTPILQPGGQCEVVVNTVATHNGGLRGALVLHGMSPIQLSGTASGFGSSTAPVADTSGSGSGSGGGSGGGNQTPVNYACSGYTLYSWANGNVNGGVYLGDTWSPSTSAQLCAAYAKAHNTAGVCANNYAVFFYAGASPRHSDVNTYTLNCTAVP